MYPKPTPTEFYSFASDIQSINANNYDVYYGKMFYTLAFAENGCFYSKYVIGDDIGRGQLGEIGISVYIPNAQKLPGADIKNLLDELINTYIQNYIIDNKIEEPKTNFDWHLFTSIADKYDEKISSRSSENDNIITGLKDPALYYYKSESDLIEHLDKPFQEEYNAYRQILFISSDLKGISDPKNVLTNSGDEVNPDLKNEYYYLSNFSFTKGVTISANGRPRSDKKRENQIRAKWQVEINYSKNPRCFEPINVKGTLSDINSEIYDYLEKKGNHIQIKYSAFDNPPEKSKELNFEIKDWKGNNIKGAKIIVGTRPPEKAEDSIKTIAFRGEEIIKEWKVSAEKKSEELYSETISIKPYTQTGSIELSMNKQKVVEIFATDEGGENRISNFKVRLNDGNGYRTNDSKITFLNDDIDKTWEIEISKREGRNNYSGITEYCPANGESRLYVKCKKTTDTEAVETIPGFESFSERPSEQKKSFALKARTFLSKSSVIASLIVSVIVIAIGVLLVVYYLGKDKSDATPLTAKQISDYVFGDSLMLDRLYDYEEKWEAQEGDKDILESIKQAIEKRTKIDLKQFNELNYGDFKKSEQQRIFYKSIDGIDSTKNEEISGHLGDISSLTLTQIKDSINAVLTLKSEEVPANQLQVQEEKQNKEEKNKSQNDEPEYITNYLETSSGFELSTINQYHSVKGLSNDLNKSLVLVKNFINGKYKNCDTFKGKALKDKFLKNNPNLESWVEEVCEDIKNVTNSTNNSENIDNNEQEFIKAFWDIVYSNKPSKQDFDNWFKTGRGIAYDNAYKVFYDKHLSTSMKFNKSIDFFKRPALERKRVKTLDDLKKEIQ